MTENSQEPDGLSNQFYMLDQLPTSFIRRYKKQLYSGNARICIHQGHANRHNHQVVIPNSSAIQLLPANPDRSRRLYPSTGQNSVLVVRVTTTAGEDPGVSNGLLQGTIFGIGSSAQNATLISQYAACSQGKLTLFPFTGNNVVNGVLNVQYQGNISGNPVTGSIQSALNTLVLQGLGVSSLSQAADHLLFCLPDGMSKYPVRVCYQKTLTMEALSQAALYPEVQIGSRFLMSTACLAIFKKDGARDSALKFMKLVINSDSVIPVWEMLNTAMKAATWGKSFMPETNGRA
jgi:hypothetical protein